MLKNTGSSRVLIVTVFGGFRRQMSFSIYSCNVAVELDN